MEELKLLIEMVAELPSMALWVLVGFFVYKVVIIGSIFGVLRLAIVKFHDWMTTPKHKLVQEDVTSRVSSLVIKGCLGDLVAQLHRVAGKGVGIESQYLHSQSIDWLREAIDMKIAADREAEQ